MLVILFSIKWMEYLSGAVQDLGYDQADRREDWDFNAYQVNWWLLNADFHLQKKIEDFSLVCDYQPNMIFLFKMLLKLAFSSMLFGYRNSLVI